MTVEIPQQYLDLVGPFVLVLARVGGVFLFAPILSSSAVPVRFRVMLAIMLALAMLPTLPAVALRPVELSLVSLAPAVLLEVLVGLIIGLFAAIPLFSVQLGGLIIGQQVGLGLANVFNPALDVNTDVIGQLFFFAAISAFIASDGLEYVFFAVARTFEHVPPGGFPHDASPVHAMVHLVGAGMEMALRIAAPVLAILLIETITMGLVMKTMPQLNILTIGFAIKVLLAFFALIVAFAAINEVITDEITRVMDALIAWASDPIPPHTGGPAHGPG